MDMIHNNDADLIQLDPGMGYTAGEYFTMMPIAAEKYDTGKDKQLIVRKLIFAHYVIVPVCFVHWL